MYLDDFQIESRQSGWIEVICGSMFSGKTEELIRRLKRAEFAMQKILLVKPKMDDRYHATNVTSHKGSSLHAIPVDSSDDILRIWKGERIVAVDEVQFFDDKIAKVCNDLANKGVRVIVAGLDMDYMGKPFGPMPELLSISESITKVHAICVSCGDLAHYSNRTVAEEEQVLVGAVEKYRPLCRKCYNQNMLE